MYILTFVNSYHQKRFISCFSVSAPAKISYSSSERLVDAVGVPYAVALGVCDMLNTRWQLGCNLEACEAV